VTHDKITVMVVDDHVLVRSGLESVLVLFDDISLVAQADNGDDAVRICAQVQPDVVLMDLVMPGMNGVTATERILADCPKTKVLALTSFTDQELIEDTLRAGAVGYLMKNITADELAAAIRTAHAGRSVLAPEAADALVRAVAAPRSSGSTITPRELQVLALMCEGLSNQEIAERLVIGLPTVKTHVSSIMAKLGASSRTEAAATAIRLGLV
jgi:NarL family two-component system response regulator LiaR